jgi:hypothetical protein
MQVNTESGPWRYDLTDLTRQVIANIFAGQIGV